MEVSRKYWKSEFGGNPFSMFYFKMKKLKKALTQQSKEMFHKKISRNSNIRTSNKIPKNPI